MQCNRSATLRCHCRKLLLNMNVPRTGMCHQTVTSKKIETWFKNKCIFLWYMPAWRFEHISFPFMTEIICLFWQTVSVLFSTILLCIIFSSSNEWHLFHCLLWNRPDSSAVSVSLFSTLMSLANGLLNDALRLGDGLSAWLPLAR